MDFLFPHTPKTSLPASMKENTLSNFFKMKYLYSLLFLLAFLPKMVGQNDTTKYICPPSCFCNFDGQIAEYPDGSAAMLKFIANNLRFPKEKECVTGKVFVGFTVEIDGTLTDFKIKRGIAGCPECDEEAIRVIKLMPKWKAGKAYNSNKPIKVNYTLPIQFKLQ